MLMKERKGAVTFKHKIKSDHALALTPTRSA